MELRTMENSENMSDEKVERLPLASKTNTNNGFINKNRMVIGVISIVVVLVVIIVPVVLVENRKKSSSSTPALQVSTKYGSVQGFELPVHVNGTFQTVNAWRGIPFAAPPVGNLRWSAPVAPRSWDGVLDTNSFASECLQASSSYGSNYTGSEDCLYLNVYSTPAAQASSAGPWPVLFYIYGGGLLVGAANANFTGLFYPNAASLQGQGLVVVEVAYRLNILGFLAAEALSDTQGGHSGNYGLQDQIFGLQWVQDNIRNFNGDPSRVTLAGQSSGGTSILALYASPAATGLFSGGMSFSGSPNISMSLAQAEAQNADIITASGCTGPSYPTSAATVACLRALPYSKLYELIPLSWSEPYIWGLPQGQGGQNYAGLCIVDGATVTMSLNEALASNLVNVPLILGNMQCEPDEDPVLDVYDYSQSQWRALLNQTFQNWTDGAAISATMASLYASEAAVNPQKAYDSIVADYGLFCGQISLLTSALSPSAGATRTAPIYVYYDEWALSKPYFDGAGTTHFAFHDLLYWELTGQWGDGINNYSPEPEDLRAQTVIQNALLPFIHHGVPGSLWQPFTANAGWPQNYTINVISNASEVSGSQVNYRRNICEYYDTIGLSSRKFWWAN